jgi:hypothetical protein
MMCYKTKFINLIETCINKMKDLIVDENTSSYLYALHTCLNVQHSWLNNKNLWKKYFLYDYYCPFLTHEVYDGRSLI